MKDNKRAELRRAITEQVQIHESGGYVSHNTGSGLIPTVTMWGSRNDDDPPYSDLTTAQQLALSVLLGDDVPLAVLVAACEDAGVFAGGVLSAAVEKARAEFNISPGSRVNVCGRPGHVVSIDIHPTRPYFDCVVNIFLDIRAAPEIPRQNSTRPT